MDWRDAPLRIQLLDAMANDIEGWEQLSAVKEDMAAPPDDDTIRTELKAMLADGLIVVHEATGPNGRLKETKPNWQYIDYEFRYWFELTARGKQLQRESCSNYDWRRRAQIAYIGPIWSHSDPPPEPGFARREAHGREGNVCAPTTCAGS